MVSSLTIELEIIKKGKYTASVVKVSTNHPFQPQVRKCELVMIMTPVFPLIKYPLHLKQAAGNDETGDSFRLSYRSGAKDCKVFEMEQG